MGTHQRRLHDIVCVISGKGSKLVSSWMFVIIKWTSCEMHQVWAVAYNLKYALCFSVICHSSGLKFFTLKRLNSLKSAPKSQDHTMEWTFTLNHIASHSPIHAPMAWLSSMQGNSQLVGTDRAGCLAQGHLARTEPGIQHATFWSLDNHSSEPLVKLN